MKRRLFEIHHRIKLKLDAICQEAGDMNTEEFMQVYESLKHDSPVTIGDNEHEIIELRNANKLAHQRIKELEQQVAKYDFLD